MTKETKLLTKTCYTKHIYAALMLYTERRGIKNMNGKFLHDIRTYQLVVWWY